MSEQLATCSLCGEFSVPWGDAIGAALMQAHQASDCPGRQVATREDQAR